MAVTGNPGDLATGGFGTGISGQAATARDVAAAVDRGAAMAADRQGGAGGLLGNAMRAGGFAGAAMPAARPAASLANQLAVSRGAGPLGLLGSPVAPNPAEVAMQKAAMIGAALQAQYGNTGLMAGGIDALARTIAGEAAGEDPLGQMAAAQTMVNRMKMAVQDPTKNYMNNLNQYSAYSDQNQPYQAAMPGTPEYDAALNAIAGAMNPDNPLPDAIKTATHYYANVGPNAINAPSWAKGQNFTQLGSHTFGLASELSPSNVAELLGAPARPSAAQIADAAVQSVRQYPTRPVSMTPAIPTGGPIDITPRPVATTPVVQTAGLIDTTNPFAYGKGTATAVDTTPMGLLADRGRQNDRIAMALLDQAAPQDSGTEQAAADATTAYEDWKARRKKKRESDKDRKTTETTQPTYDIAQYVPQWWMDWYNTYGKTGGVLG